MPDRRDVAVLVGSLRKASLTRKTALALARLAPDDLALSIVEIAGLPLYDQDREGDPAWAAFRARVVVADAVLFVTPEYNRSVPGVLKNAIDVGSRPYGKSVWSGKPAAVVSVSPGAIGGLGANHHLRQSLAYLNMPTMQQPEAYVGQADKLFSETGEIESESVRSFLREVMAAFARWIERNRAPA